MMGLIVKLETFINSLLIKLWQLTLKLFSKILPSKIKDKWNRFLQVFEESKSLPKKILPWILNKVQQFKNSFLSYDIKGKLKETYTEAIARYKIKNENKKFGQLKKVLLTPFLMISQWLQGLTGPQSLLLLSFSAASFLAIVHIVFSGQRIVRHQSNSRTPASVNEEVSYDRPEYYKMHRRHLGITNLKLPVYVAEINELKSVTIDFTATLSNRQSRMALEKLEFQLRDFIILQVEPSVASFPLQEEGKEIIRQKILLEINNFLKEREIGGHVEDLKLTYILAN